MFFYDQKHFQRLWFLGLLFVGNKECTNVNEYSYAQVLYKIPYLYLVST